MGSSGWTEVPGTVLAADTSLAAELEAGDAFGASACAVGDLDGDEVWELAVGAPGDENNGMENRGAVYILFFTVSESGDGEATVTLSSFKKLTADPNTPSFRLGRSLAMLGEVEWAVTTGGQDTVSLPTLVAGGLGGDPTTYCGSTGSEACAALLGDGWEVWGNFGDNERFGVQGINSQSDFAGSARWTTKEFELQ